MKVLTFCGLCCQASLLRQGCGIAHTVLAGLVKAACVCTGGVFKLELFLPEDYPMAAPKVGVPLWIGSPALRQWSRFNRTSNVLL